ncbi:hypothetical protein RHPLAN_52570 [Rhodoplanes sp. Z2-YC6860]|nr:hypothetical protein RHPLAN_52570 [Rhodoplanes sp. Z2-YC6860]
MTLISKRSDNSHWTLNYVLNAPRRLRARPQCGAKTRAGTPCKNAATIISRRCRMHGGAGSGAPLGNKNALKHGYYTREAIEARRKFAELKRAAAAHEENSTGVEASRSRSKGASDLAFMRDALAGLSREPAGTEEKTAAESTPIPDQSGQYNAADANDNIDALAGPEGAEPTIATARQKAGARPAQRRDATMKAGQTPVAAQRKPTIEMMVCVADEGNFGLGRRAFSFMPREGDYVTLTEEQRHATYRVVAMLLTEGCASPGIDLFVAEGRPSDEIGVHLRRSLSLGTAECGESAPRWNATTVAKRRPGSANRHTMT